MKRRLTIMLVAAPLTFALAHCADAEPTATIAESETAEQIVSVRPDAGDRDQFPVMTDAGTPARDAAAPSGGDASVSAPFAITSTIVQDKGMLPKKYRGNVASPPLAWTAGPEGTKSYALVFRDLGNNFFHWVIYDIPATELGLPEGVPVGAALEKPAGAKQAANWSGRVGYGGPAAPSGVSNYAFTVYALSVDKLAGLSARPTSAQVLTAIEKVDLASTRLTIQSTPSAP
jgi:Raf kinase inhibitor-like YbhB/YbcL family protein